MKTKTDAGICKLRKAWSHARGRLNNLGAGTSNSKCYEGAIKPRQPLVQISKLPPCKPLGALQRMISETTRAYAYTCIHVYMHTCTHAYMETCVCAGPCIQLCMRVIITSSYNLLLDIKPQKRKSSLPNRNHILTATSFALGGAKQ